MSSGCQWKKLESLYSADGSSPKRTLQGFAVAQTLFDCCYYNSCQAGQKAARGELRRGPRPGFLLGENIAEHFKMIRK